MAIITISRTFGSFGNEIAQMLADELGYHLLTRENASAMLLDSGFSESHVSTTFSEEGRPSLFEHFASDRDRLLGALKTALYTFAQQDHVVIMGMGAQVVFHGLPHVLRVKITAPLDVRLKRVQHRYGCEQQAANHLLASSDQARSGFTRYFFNEDWESMQWYDVMINTDRISIAGAVRLITCELREFDAPDQTAQARARLQDLIVQQQVVQTILYEAGLEFLYLNAVADSGVVTLHGYSRSADNARRSEELARTVAGVKQVVNNIFIEASGAV